MANARVQPHRHLDNRLNIWQFISLGERWRFQTKRSGFSCGSELFPYQLR